jgi:hypothetical protein
VLGAAPEDLMNTRVRIAEIAEIRPGHLSRRGIETNPKGSHWLLQIRDFNPQRTSVNRHSMIRFSPEHHSSTRPLQTGEIVFLAKGARPFAYALSDIPDASLAAGAFFVLHIYCIQVLPAYLAWFLNQESTLAIIARAATSGAHMPVVRRADLESVEIPLPPLPVQHAIVQVDILRRQEHDLLCELVHKRSTLIAAACASAAQSETRTGAAHE